MEAMDEDPPPAAAAAALVNLFTGPSAGPSPTPSTPATQPGRPALSSKTDATSSSAASSAAPSHDNTTRAAAAAASKRRRGIGAVTPNACTECRKKRAKCDGQHPCSRCKHLDVAECVYEVPVRQSKEHLREEIELLRRHQRNSDQVLAAVARPDLCDDVLARLRNGQSVNSISEWLAGVTHPLGGPGALPSASNPAADMTTHASSSGNPPIASYASGVAASFSPISTHDPRNIRHENEPNSPWGAFSSFTSQSKSATTESHPYPMHWTSGTRQRVGTWLSDEDDNDNPRFRGLQQVLSPEIPDMKVPAGAWTKVTDDSRLVQHLLALYFCWEYPTFASLSKEHFLRDFQDGRTRFCSSILVNALLALGCRFSSHPTTRTDPDDPYTSGDHFFKECLRLFYKEVDHTKLTTIQALGIMSIREASCGRDSESWYYAGQSIRLALEMGLQQNPGDGLEDDEVAVRSATFWGAFSLDLAWALATGTLPHCSFYPRLPPKQAIINDVEASLWIPYTDDGAPLERSCEQPSNVRSVFKCFCELSELVQRSLYIIHSPNRPLSGRDLQDTYTAYLRWYDQIPEVLRLGHNFTPAVLFAHMYYHYSILLFFRPFIKLRIVGSSLVPRDICEQAADAIQGLTRSYSQLYTLRRTPSFVPYFVLTASIMHLTIGASRAAASSQAGQSGNRTNGSASGQAQTRQGSTSASGMEPRTARAISRGIADLTEMAPCHHFAHRALNILVYLAKRWDIDIQVQANDQEHTGKHPSEKTSARQLRMRGLRPSTDSMNFFSVMVTERDMMCSWREQANLAEDEVPNPLFWPFPLQGRPIVPVGDALRQAGFERIL